MSPNYYNVLEIEELSSIDEVKKAYKKLAKKYHPDVSEDKSGWYFLKIKEAYDVLSDENKKEIYDRKIKRTKKSFNYKDLESLFKKKKEEINVEDELVLSFEESIKGCVKNFNSIHKVKCKECDGEGIVDKDGFCLFCGGTGKESKSNSFFNQNCFNCKGTGKTQGKTCISCNGRKFLILNEKEVIVNVHGGVVEGEKILVKNGGFFGGNLILNIKIKEHDLFVRDGFNVISVCNLNYSSFLLGTKVKVETVYGSKEIKINPKSNTNQEIIIKDCGVNGISKKGDHIVVLNLVYPDKVTDRHIELLKEFDQII